MQFLTNRQSVEKLFKINYLTRINLCGVKQDLFSADFVDDEEYWYQCFEALFFLFAITPDK
jgi:hypothetical protein